MWPHIGPTRSSSKAGVPEPVWNPTPYEWFAAEGRSGMKVLSVYQPDRMHFFWLPPDPGGLPPANRLQLGWYPDGLRYCRLPASQRVTRLKSHVNVTRIRR